MSLQPTSRDLYSIDEAAIVLRVTEAHVRQLIRDDQITAALIGGRYLIPRSALDGYVERRIGVKRASPAPIYEKRDGKAVRIA